MNPALSVSPGFAVRAAAWLLVACAAAGEARAGDSPFVKEPAPREDARRGVIERSDGQVCGGTISMTRAAKLEIYDLKKKTWLELRPAAIRRIEFKVASQEVVKEWKFREGGFDEKVFTGRVKLDRKYEATATYVEREETRAVTGNVKGAPVYVEHWDGQKYRFFLLHDQSGEWTTPEKVETSLTYTKWVDFTMDPDEARKQVEAKKGEGKPEAKPPAGSEGNPGEGPASKPDEKKEEKPGPDKEPKPKAPAP